MHQDHGPNQDQVEVQLSLPAAYWSRFNPSPERVASMSRAQEAYDRQAGKRSVDIFIRDAINSRDGIEWNLRDPLARPAIALLDASPVQRLRSLAQSSFGHILYPGMEHSRFTHTLGVAHLTIEVLNDIRSRASLEVQKQIEFWGPVSVAVAMLHDVGHIAPRSHIAQRVWFPDQADMHEAASLRIVNEHYQLRYILGSIFPEQKNFADLVASVMAEDPSVPEWTWRIVTGGGWNSDRGDWVQRDKSASKGEVAYNIALIRRNLMFLDDGKLVLGEKGVPELRKFIWARAESYTSDFAHKNARVGEELVVLMGRRLRELYQEGTLNLDDTVLYEVLASSKIDDLSLDCLLEMDDGWWGGIMSRAYRSGDAVLNRLSRALAQRDLPKMVEDTDENRKIFTEAAFRVGLDPRYSVMVVPEQTFSYRRDIENCMPILRRDGTLCSITEVSPELKALSSIDDMAIQSHLAAFPEVWLGLEGMEPVGS
jgi:HD superfamily phosphohydrolase